MSRLARFCATALAGGLLLGAWSGATAEAQNHSASGSGSGSGSPPAGSTVGGTVTWAEPSSQTPDFIYPFMPAPYFDAANIDQFQQLMYRPLFWFGNSTGAGLDKSLSLARPPKYGSGASQVTIHLKHYVWSNGEELDVTQVMQWLNMLHAEKQNWAPYLPGVGLPDELVGVTIKSKYILVLHLAVSVNVHWFNFNMLSQITPLPEAWDITSLGAAPGSGGCGSGAWGAPSTDAACQAVWNFMTNQAGYHPGSITPLSSYASTYTSNSLWQVVDGPWKLTSFDSSGTATFVPNATYSGSVFPLITKFVEVPFQSDSAELSALKAGQLTVGYLPLDDVKSPAKSPVDPGANLSSLDKHYRIVPYYSWSINYVPINFNSGANGGSAGAILSQQYVRQALQMLVDQDKLVREVDDGYGVPVYDPTPIVPSTTSLKHLKKMDTYHPKQVSGLLHKHGWTMVNGTQTCVDPGSAPDECGPGVTQGAQLDFDLMYPLGPPSIAKRLSLEASSWSSKGIHVTLSAVPAANIVSTEAPCSPSPACSWEMISTGSGWTFGPDAYYPSGERILLSGAPDNVGSYANPVGDNLIFQTMFTNVPLEYYAEYMRSHSPVLFQDNPVTYLYEVNKTLHGVTPLDPLGNYEPENFYFMK
jgi:peptide/nickel transport system substrate-binding protein